MWVSPAANSTMVNCMYRIIPHKLLYTIVAWLILGVYLGVNSIAQWLQAELRLSSAITLGWMLISALLLNPVWRWVWKKVPPLGRWIFPDLNGEWDVEIVSNHSRSEEHTSELQSLMRLSYAVFCLKKKQHKPKYDKR